MSQSHDTETHNGEMSDRLMDAVLSAGVDAGITETEVTVAQHVGGLTRFANNMVHQHVVGDDTTVSVRVILNGQVGASTTNDASTDGATAALKRALEAARLTPSDPSWPGLAGPSELAPWADRYDQPTAEASPADRVKVVAELLGELGPQQRGAGALSTSATQVSFATSAGARHNARSTRASLSTVVMGPTGESGWAEDGGIGIRDIDGKAIGTRAAALCHDAANPQPVEPGDHTVVLASSAVMTLVDHLGLCAFSGKAYEEGRSAFSGRLGDEVASPLINIYDDALEPGAMGLPFDGEGTPKSRVDLITKGIACGVVHDRTSGAKAGVTSTGHGLAGPNPWGPYASNLVLAPGSQTLDELIAGVDYGLLVTRFWYTRMVNPKQSLITGMTRDGTFRIENGQVVGPVRNLRFNVSILDSLTSCDGVGDTLQTCCDEGGDTRVPALRLRSFAFTSVTDH